MLLTTTFRFIFLTMSLHVHRALQSVHDCLQGSPMWCRSAERLCDVCKHLRLLSAGSEGNDFVSMARSFEVCLCAFLQPDGIVLKPYALKCVPLPNASDSAVFSN